MVFLRGQSQHDSWQRFCTLHREVLAKTGLPAGVISSEHRVRELLQEGIVEVGNTRSSLEALAEFEWNSLASFASIYFREWDSYATQGRFPAFFKEAERRDEHPGLDDE
jgi:hypothetical protein